MHRLKTTLLGEPFPTSRSVHERLDKIRALAVFASDPISSNAYATEAILFILVALGSDMLHLAFPIAVAVAILVSLVVLSYNQTIQHYPQGGGAYSVTKDNLGPTPSLVAAAALLVDYTLTVSVSVAAGVKALSSAFPPVHDHRVAIGILIIVVITYVNLRGVRESGTIFAVPTYAFVGGLYLVLGIGLLRYFGVLDAPLDVSPQTVEATAEFSRFAIWWLVLRAFAAGCTALTGIEAISNGVGAFKPPEPRNAILTMRAMAVMAMTLFLAISFLATHIGLVPNERESVLSQLTTAVVGRSPLYYWVQSFTMLILVLAANTAYQDFPRLSAFLARDGYLPRWMTNVGHRLVFSTGIITLAILASIVLVVFQGDEIRLLPLYAIGVFVSFTLSQTGMVKLWGKVSGLKPGERLDTAITTLHYEEGWRWKRAANVAGATATAVVLVVLAATKFLEGAWMVLLAIPLLVIMFRGISGHYATVRSGLRTSGTTRRELLDPADVAIVPVGDIHRCSLQAVRLANRLAHDVRVVWVAVDPKSEERFLSRWERWRYLTEPAEVVVLKSPYREVVDPLVEYIEMVSETEFPGRLTTVVVPEFVPETPLANLLHNQTAALLRLRLRSIEQVVVIDVPYHLHGESIEEGGSAETASDQS